jgi:uncharacterized protein YjbI with pentapeptide repeats
MPRVVKPGSLSLLFKTERWASGTSFIVTVFGMFDLANSEAARFESEQAMWPLTAKLMPERRVLDLGMPKPCAEVLVGGVAVAPGRVPVPRVALQWAIGGVDKTILVTGDRYWSAEGLDFRPTEPVPFLEMPLTPARAFGGAGYATNPDGVGFRAGERVRSGLLAPLPNIERGDALVSRIDQTPPPATFAPIAVDDPGRNVFAGTYDEQWLRTLAPGLPADVDPRLFLFAPPDQRLDRYLEPGEPYLLRNFARDAPLIQGTIPRLKVRCFVGHDGRLFELALRIDTLWLLAGARRGIVVHRGAMPVTDIEGLDVTDVMIAYERVGEPRDVAHYLEVFELRTNPDTAHKYAFSESQLATPLSPEETARRKAARRERALQQAAASRATNRWLLERELVRAGLPRDLMPELPEDDEEPEFLLPTPEEIASGDFDLADVLDAAEAMTRKAQAELERAASEIAPAAERAARLQSGEAEASDVDALLDALGAGEGARQIDAAMAELPPLPSVPDEAGPEKLAELGAVLDRALDWRGEMIAAATPNVDEAAQFVAARARFLNLPEGRPFAQVREALDPNAFAAPALPPLGVPDEAPRPAPADEVPSIDRILELLEIPERDGAHIEKARAAFADANAALAKAMPRLASDGRSPIETLMAQGVSHDRLTPEEAIGRAQDRVGEALAAAHSGLDEAEQSVVDAMASMRRMAPAVMAPGEPLTPWVARRLADIVIAEHRAGRSLAGRDLAGADLSGEDLSHADLTGALLERARLDRARLIGARLDDAALTRASLKAAVLSGASMQRANLSGVDAEGCAFDRAIIVQPLLFEARFDNASFVAAHLSNWQLMQSSADGAHFEGARIDEFTVLQGSLNKASFRGADANEIRFLQVAMTGADFAQARIRRAAFMQTALAGASFREARMETCAFIGDIDLTGACFAAADTVQLSIVGARLPYLDAVGARMNAAYFGDSDLRNADFGRASLRSASLSRLPLQGANFFAANLFEARLNRAQLDGASLRFANLFGADLQDATLAAVDLTGANLTRTMFLAGQHAG